MCRLVILLILLPVVLLGAVLAPSSFRSPRQRVTMPSVPASTAKSLP
jgi:hypothetical protein